MRNLLFSALILSACDGGDDGVVLDSGPNDAGPPDTGAGPVKVSLSTTSLDLGAIVVTSSKRATFTIENPGSSRLEVALSAPSGSGASLFARTVNVPEADLRFPLEPGGIATVTVEGSPDAPGPIEAELSVDSCAGACPTAVRLAAEGVLSGVACPVRIDLGVANPGDCISMDATCTNEGNATERITVVEIEPASDPEYAIVEPALPIDLAPSASFTFGVTYCPTMLGDDTGSITVATFRPFETERSIALSGRGGGPDVDCTPESVDFGSVGVGASVQIGVVCANHGVEPAMVEASIAGGGEFTVDGAPTEIRVNEVGIIFVRHSPTSPGDKRDTLLVRSNDPDSPELTIPLVARAVNVDPCSATVSPVARNAGLVAIGERRPVRFTVQNTGAADCLVRDVQISSTTPEAFALEPVSPGSVIAPAETRDIVVYVAPDRTAMLAATLVVGFTNPGTTELTASVSASGAIAPIVVEPRTIDFGATPIGCAAPTERTVRIRRVLGGTGSIVGVDVVDDFGGAFSSSSNPGPLSFFQTLDVTVGFAPATVGRHEAFLEILTDSAPVPVRIAMVGEGVASADQTETVVLAPRKVDVLMVVDDSATMALAQAALSDTIDGFEDVRARRAADVRFAVITTDMEDPNRSGRMFGATPFVDSSSPTFLAELEARVVPGTGGSGNEQGILAIHSAITPPVITMENAGFLRPGADLAVIAVSDENDFSPLAPAVSTVLAELRRSTTERLTVAGIVGPISGTCSGPSGGATAAIRWAELIARADRYVMASFCADMRESLRAIAGEVFGGASVDLAGTPVIASIAVRVNGAALPSSSYAYDLATNRIVILDDAAAPPGATVEVGYRSRCASPSCGDGTLDPQELCDDENTDPSDACVSCEPAVCGDAFVWTGSEACDDGNLVDGDACLPGCVAAACGDGVLRQGVEECDDGNVIGGDGCPATCRFYQLAGPVSIPFVPLAGGATLTFSGGGDPNDDGVASILLPFTLSFFDVPTSSLTVSVNGFASTTSGAAPQSWINEAFPTAGLPDGVLAPWWDDLMLDTAIAGGAAITWGVVGSAPLREVVIEWRDVRHRDHETLDHRRFTFQLRVEETTNVVRFAYADTETSGTVPSVVSASAGIEDPSAARGLEALGCSPTCDGRPRPPRADGFPFQSEVSFAP